MKTLFSGIKPSGELHLGNYIGAISQWVKLQKQYNCFFCVVDYHAITVKQDPKILRKRILDIARIYLASGMDPKKATIFQQSDVTEHTELGWILNTITTTGELAGMTQFKEKTLLDLDTAGKQVSEKISKDIIDKMKEYIKKKLNHEQKEAVKDPQKRYISELLVNSETEERLIIDTVIEVVAMEIKSKFNKAGAGLFGYPTLMAADVLLYNTDVVPVGHDQMQHLELTRVLARRFNSEFGQTFKVPETVVRKEGARIMGLDDPSKKMSKSSKSPNSYIALMDDPILAHKKIKRAVTDSGTEIKYDLEKKPAISNLLAIYSALENKSVRELEIMYEHKNYGEFKEDLANVVASFLEDFQAKYKKYSDKEVRKILDNGAKKAKKIAEKTMTLVKKNLGVN